MNERPPTPSTWRLIESGPGDPAWNMAVDEALLDGFREGEHRPILRLYRWRPAALSLGRFQPAADVPLPEGAVRVRRLSGGAAIHHREDEVTYAVVAPYALFGERSPRAGYRAVHAVLGQALLALGVAPPDLGVSQLDAGELGAGELEDSQGRGPSSAGPLRGMCFDAATDYDLLARGRKLIGSAQRRGGGARRAFLQHGSLPLSPDPAAAGAISLSELLGAPPDADAVARAIREAFAAHLAAELLPDALRETERVRAAHLVSARYGAHAWTFER